jgi:Tol biopolymer transport system component
VPAAPGPVFVSRRSNAPELWMAPRDGRPARALTQLGGVVAAPAWSPAGDRVAFVGSCGPAGRHGVCRLDLATGHVQPLATDAAEYGRPAWHPDGRSVWVTSDRGGRWQVWRLDADSGQALPVATDEEPGRLLGWEADGRHFVVESRDRGTLYWHGADGLANRTLVVAGNGRTALDWRIANDGLVLLTRGSRERLERFDAAGVRRSVLADLPLGTLPERARLAIAANGGLLVEVADTATADLMQAR